MTGQLSIERHNAEGMQRIKAELLRVYQEVYAERLSDPFFDPERFWQRLAGYASREGFELVTARQGDELIGFTLGETLPEGSTWWKGVKGDIDPTQLQETGRRTFAINELMVLPAWRRRGYAKLLSAALLDGRTEERATLLVRAENTSAYNAYLSWGFRVIGQIQPFEDSPVYEAMVKEL